MVKRTAITSVSARTVCASSIYPLPAKYDLGGNLKHPDRPHYPQGPGNLPSRDLVNIQGKSSLGDGSHICTGRIGIRRFVRSCWSLLALMMSLNMIRFEERTGQLTLASAFQCRHSSSLGGVPGSDTSTCRRSLQQIWSISPGDWTGSYPCCVGFCDGENSPEALIVSYQAGF